MFKDPDFRRDYVDRYQQLRTNIWSVQNTNAIAITAAQIREARARNGKNGGTLQTAARILASEAAGKEVGHLKGGSRLSGMDGRPISYPLLFSSW